MWLTVEASGRVQTHNLGTGSVVVGRGLDVNVRVADPEAGARHCQIYAAEGKYAIQDLGSGKPTLVNGAATERGWLSPGDRIQIGQAILTMHATKPAPAAPAPVAAPAPTDESGPDETGPADSGRSAAGRPRAPSRRLGRPGASRASGAHRPAAGRASSRGRPAGSSQRARPTASGRHARAGDESGRTTGRAAAVPKKDNTMLIVGGAGGGVLLLVVIILAASGRGGGGGFTGGGGGGASFDPLARAKDLDKQAADLQSGTGESKMEGRRCAYQAYVEYRTALSSPSLAVEQRSYAQSRVNSMASWASLEDSARSAVPAYAAKVDKTSVDSGKAVYDEGFAMLSKYGATSYELQLREAVDKAGRMAGSAASEDWGGRFHGKRSKARSLAEQGDTAKAVKLLEDFLAEGPPPEVAQKCQSEIENLKSGGGH